MLREETVFGPIHSRRLGISLGINLLPVNGKLCNFDCIYCECGLNSDGTSDRLLPDRRRVREALEHKLIEAVSHGTAIDSITFSGSGEPTLNPDFAGIIDDTLELRDRFFSNSVVSVLSNATMVHKQSVFEALCKVDNPIMKIDASSDEFVGLINRPSRGYELERIVSDLEKFEGNFILQTIFLEYGEFFSGCRANLDGWMEIVRRLRPREIMVYTVDRPTPETGVAKVSEQRMKELVTPLIEEGFKIQICG